MKQTLTQRIEVLEKRIEQIAHYAGQHDKGCTCQGVPVNPEPYTAMRSTGIECDKCPHEYCECVEYTPYERHEWNPHCSVCFKLIHPSRVGFKPIKPKEDVKKKLKTYLTNNIGLNNNLEYIANSIIEIVNK